MLRALTRLVRGRTRRADLTQLSLELGEALRNADELFTRLRELGLRRITRCRLTRNGSVMVSFQGSELRIHEGYLAAPRDVHAAIVTFVEGRTRAARRAARHAIVSFPVTVTRRPPRKERMHPEDEPMASRLTAWHGEYNTDHFGGRLRAIRVRLSRRMKSRLGHYTAATNDTPAEIAISRRHLRRHGWAEALHTLLHEMVHQWQDEAGLPIDHGPAFRNKAREVGIEPRASRRKEGN